MDAKERCGHSRCSQHYIDTGDMRCLDLIEAVEAEREACALLLTDLVAAFRRKADRLLKSGERLAGIATEMQAGVLETGVMLIRNRKSDARPCSICRGYHGREIVHACE